MRRRPVGALALAVVAALTCTGCVRTDAAYHAARRQALEDARRVADEVERRQLPATGADPGTPGYHPPGTNAGMLERIADEFSGTEAHPDDRVLKRELVSGQPWTGFLGAVEVQIGREAERGSSLFHVRQAASVCVRFELHGDNGRRRVTIREIDCPPWSPPPRAGPEGGGQASGSVPPATWRAANRSSISIWRMRSLTTRAPSCSPRRAMRP